MILYRTNDHLTTELINIALQCDYLLSENSYLPFSYIKLSAHENRFDPRSSSRLQRFWGQEWLEIYLYIKGFGFMVERVCTESSEPGSCFLPYARGNAQESDLPRKHASF